MTKEELYLETIKIILKNNIVKEDNLNKLKDINVSFALYKEMKKIPSLDNNYNNYERVDSFNNESNIDKNTKYVIVGTLTPPEGRKRGFFYTSSNNKVFGLIDEYIIKCDPNEDSLVVRKNILKNSNNQKEIINEIKTILNNYKIAFLDVIKSAIVTKDSSSDNDIHLFSLDYKAFEDINENVIFICTSKKAKICLEKILLNNKNYKILSLYQDIFHIKNTKNELEKIINNSKNIFLNKNPLFD